MNTEQERADFEAWAEQRGMELHKVSPCDGSPPYYADTPGIAAWEAWQARAALQSQKSKGNDIMLSGVIRMPFEMAMADPISRMQFYQRAQQALNELEAMQSQDAEDAERYRWLRNRAEGEGLCAVHIDYWSDEYTGQAGCDVYCGEFLDAAIDQARRREEDGE